MEVSRNGPRILGMPPGVLATYGAGLAMALVTIAAVWLATHAMVERAAARELQDTRLELENYAKTLAGHIERTIGTVDRSLLAIKRDVERGRGVWPDAELATEHRAHGDFVSVLTVADARGDVISSSISSKGVNLAGRQHFIALRETGDAGVVLGLPVRGQASGLMTMHAARRLNARDGSFKGIVSAGLNLDYFARFYRGIDLGSGGAIEIIGLDGLPRIGEGARGAPSGRAAWYATLIDRVRRGETRGTDTGVAGPDGPLLRSHYALDSYPLVVTVAKSEAEALRGIVQYRKHAYAYAGGVTLLILALMASAHFLLRRQGGMQAALSGSEARFRALTELTSDWYWETDAENRFTLMSAGIAHWRMRVPADYLGKRRWELAFLSPLEGGWERHQETVQARQPFRDFVVRHTDFDGNVGYASVSGEPLADAHGRHLGYRGVGRDVTAEIRLQQRLKLQHRVSAILANARSAQAAVTEVLRAACETFDWQWGARRLTDGATVSCGETWCVPELERSAFARQTRETVYPRLSGGIMERALRSGEPQWVPAEGGGMPRRMSIATAAGLRMLITVPVSCGGHAIGALEFSSSRLERPDALLSGTLRVLGEMVGQFLQRQSEMEQRQHVEAVLSESELRYQATFDLAGVGIVHTSFEGTYLRVNRKFCEMLGYPAEELIGRNGSEFSHPDDALIGVGNRERVLTGELDTFSQERRYIRKDGRTIWTNRTVSLARDASGKPLYFIRVIEDVTARKEAEERDRATFDNAPVGIMHTALDGYGVLRANRKLCEMLGYTQEELLSMTSTEFVHPDYRYKDHSRYAQQLISGEIQSYASERKFVRKDGSSLWVNRTVSLVRDASGEPLYFIRVLEDISERRRAEEEVEHERALLRATFDQAGVGMAISEIAADGQRWLRVNQKLCDILGRTREELLAMSPLELAPPGERRHAADFNEKLLRDEVATYAREKQYVRKDGQVIWASVSLAAVRGPDGRASRVVSVVQDVTEQMRSQRALIESEVQFNQLAGNIPQVFWITDAAHRRVIYVSAACESVLGHTPAELKAAPRQLVGAVHPADRRRVYEARKSAATGRYDEIYRIIRPDGTTRWLHDRAFPVRDAEGRPYRIAGIAEDITERRRAEDALRESEERYRQAAEALANERNLLRSVIDAIPDDIYVKDRELRYVLLNARGLEIRGIRGGREIKGRSAADFYPPTVSAGFDAEDRAVLAGGAPVVNRELEVVHVNGRRETQLATKVPLRDLEGNIVGAIGISRDITQLKERTEEISRLNAELEQRVRERTAQLELSNRELESFAFSVSHDLRAPLRTIEGFSRILYNEYAGGIDQEGRDCLRRVQAASQRMARLIDALLSLSRITRSRIRLRPVDLSSLAREIGDELLQEDALRRVQFSVAPGMTARADASLLRAVFDNLLRNAWKFTAQAELASIEVGSVLREGRCAYFVRDNGVGFDMSYAGNLFGAFQRLHTEAEFPGTGIGLATVQRIIRRHGGEVWAEAEPGKGAVFYFTLGEVGPAAKEPAVRASAGREAATG